MTGLSDNEIWETLCKELRRTKDVPNICPCDWQFGWPAHEGNCSDAQCGTLVSSSNRQETYVSGKEKLFVGLVRDLALDVLHHQENRD